MRIFVNLKPLGWCYCRSGVFDVTKRRFVKPNPHVTESIWMYILFSIGLKPLGVRVWNLALKGETCVSGQGYG